MPASVGALLVSSTNTVKLCVALKLGTPLSVTMTAIGFVDGPCASLGVQVNAPLFELTCAPGGAPAPRLNNSVLGGASVSPAPLVNVSSPPSNTVEFEMPASVGALLVSSTNTVKLCVALKLGTPLSVTMTAIGLVLGPCASLRVPV